MPHRPQAPIAFHSALVALLLLALTGCAQLGLGSSTGKDAAAPADTAATNPPYNASDFRDLLIPGELAWNRDKSMIIRTDSYAGGVLNFSGRVEIASLSEFFVQNMERNGWKMAGSIKYKQVLLAFIKPAKTCTITIADGNLGLNTEVNIYITEDITKRDQAATGGSTKPSGY